MPFAGFAAEQDKADLVRAFVRLAGSFIQKSGPDIPLHFCLNPNFMNLWNVQNTFMHHSDNSLIL
jgi:hypothetical protein